MRTLMRFVVVFAAALVVGCGAIPEDDSSTSTTVTAPAKALSAAATVAREYALAARSWTPSTYRAQYRTQMRLATGRLRAELRLSAPRSELIAQYRKDNARMEARVLSIVANREAASNADFTLEVFERSVAAGQNIAAQETYGAEVVRRGGRWRVLSFTVLP